MYQVAFAVIAFATLICAPALAAVPQAPELDAGTLSSLVAGLSGCYAVYKISRAKR